MHCDVAFILITALINSIDKKRKKEFSILYPNLCSMQERSLLVCQ